MFSRRKFFGLLGGVVAAKVAAPIYVLAPPCGWNAGTIFTPMWYGVSGKIKIADRYEKEILDNVMRRFAFAYNVSELDLARRLYDNTL